MSRTKETQELRRALRDVRQQLRANSPGMNRIITGLQSVSGPIDIKIPAHVLQLMAATKAAAAQFDTSGIERARPLLDAYKRALALPEGHRVRKTWERAVGPFAPRDSMDIWQLLPSPPLPRGTPPGRRIPEPPVDLGELIATSEHPRQELEQILLLQGLPQNRVKNRAAYLLKLHRRGK